MKPVIIINCFSIKPGKMDEFIETQQNFAASLMDKPGGLIGGRMYRGLDGKSAVLVSQFASEEAQQGIFQLDAFKQHLNKLRPLVESSSPSHYEEAYTSGAFK